MADFAGICLTPTGTITILAIDVLFLDAPPCSFPTSLVLSPMPRGKIFFRMLPIQGIPYFKRPAALLRPPDSLFLLCLNSSSFKTSSLSLQYLKLQAFKSQVPKSSSIKSQGFKHVHTQDSLFTSFVTGKSLLVLVSHHDDIRPLLAVLGSRAMYSCSFNSTSEPRGPRYCKERAVGKEIQHERTQPSDSGV
jgi:hypothetical protein